MICRKLIIVALCLISVKSFYAQVTIEKRINIDSTIVDYYDIIFKIKRLITDDPENIYYYRVLGDSYYSLNDYDSAEFFYKEAYYITKYKIKDENEVLEINNRLGYINLLNERYKQSIGFFEQSLSIDSLNLFANYQIAKSYEKIGNYEVTLNYFNRVNKLEYNYNQVFNEIGKAYFNLNEFELSKESFEKSLVLDSTNCESYLNLGNLLFIEKDFINSELKYINAFNYCESKNKEMARQQLIIIYKINGEKKKIKKLKKNQLLNIEK